MAAPVKLLLEKSRGKPRPMGTSACVPAPEMTAYENIPRRSPLASPSKPPAIFLVWVGPPPKPSQTVGGTGLPGERGGKKGPVLRASGEQCLVGWLVGWVDGCSIVASNAEHQLLRLDSCFATEEALLCFLCSKPTIDFLFLLSDICSLQNKQ